jgi:hypothetical protein
MSSDMPFKIGQTVYSLSSLKQGIITNIVIGENGCNYNISVQFADQDNIETCRDDFITTDPHKIIDLLRSQVEEYRDSFFREKNINRNLLQGRISKPL